MTATTSTPTYEQVVADNTAGVSIDVPYVTPRLVCDTASGDTLQTVTPEDTQMVVEDPLDCFEYPSGLTLIQLDTTSQNGGTVTTGSIIYDPALNYHGADSFEYTVSDGVTDFTVTVLVDIVSVNDLPYLANPFGEPEKPQFTIAAALGDTLPALNPVDVDGDQVVVTAQGALPDGITLTTSGVFIGTVQSNGTYVIVLSLDDGNGGVSVYDMTIVVGKLPFTGLPAPLAMTLSLLMIGIGTTLVRRSRSFV